MAFWCYQCHTSFSTPRARALHIRQHRFPKPKEPNAQRFTHPHLTARPCDEQGNFLEPDAAPPAPPPLPENPYDPFHNRPSFEMAELLFEKIQCSEEDVDRVFRIWKAQAIASSADSSSIFYGMRDMLSAIDSIPHGEGGWTSFSVRYTGPLRPNTPSWMRRKFVVHAQDIRQVMKNLLGNAEFSGKFDYVAYEEFVNGKRRYSDFMSGQWATNESTTIANDPATFGSMLVPIILGADKTTVSVATGHTEYHPLYATLGNLYNAVRRGHGDAVVPIAFLAIPKGANATEDKDPEFRIWKKQLYHGTIAQVLMPLKAAMTTPVVMRCPDGHFRKVIYSVGPFIADYPEQVYLSGIVQGWCPKCLALNSNLDEIDAPRFRELSQALREDLEDDEDLLRDAFGIAPGVKPFTDHFPRADIHLLLSPDLLHQLIKGTFKDHLVTWVYNWIEENYDGPQAQDIIAEIDNRLAVVPSFPGLRHFVEGRAFKQWTGDDSKGLMKIFIPAVEAWIPDKMTQCLSAFNRFCYAARLSSHDTDSLARMAKHLRDFQDLRTVFLEEDIRDTFALPRQHALVHYVDGIRLFASLTGLCSSITESKHIHAVKKPWRRSNRRNPLHQILKTLTRLRKIAAMRSVLGSRGHLKSDVLSHAVRVALRKAKVKIPSEDEWEDVDESGHRADAHGHAQDEDEVDWDAEPPSVLLASKYNQSSYIPDLRIKAEYRHALPNLIRRFLYEQLYPDRDDADTIALDQCPTFDDRVAVYHSARAFFYAPSELCGPGGMHCEVIRSTPRWYGQGERRDTVLVQTGEEDGVMGGMHVAQVVAFLRFKHRSTRYPCALVEWFNPSGDAVDPINGMWVVKPEFERRRAHDDARRRTLALIHLDTVVRACHLQPVYGKSSTPSNMTRARTLRAYKAYYLNQFADYHTYECYPNPL